MSCWDGASLVTRMESLLPCCVLEGRQRGVCTSHTSCMCNTLWVPGRPAHVHMMYTWSFTCVGTSHFHVMGLGAHGLMPCTCHLCMLHVCYTHALCVCTMCVLFELDRACTLHTYVVTLCYVCTLGRPPVHITCTHVQCVSYVHMEHAHMCTHMLHVLALLCVLLILMIT